MNIGSNIDRRDLLAPLIPNPDDYLIVTGLAGPARDAAALTQDGGNTFTMAGCMGASVRRRDERGAADDQAGPHGRADGQRCW